MAETKKTERYWTLVKQVATEGTQTQAWYELVLLSDRERIPEKEVAADLRVSKDQIAEDVSSGR